MEAWGEGRKGIMVVGEAPGEVEDRRNKPWQGPAGQALQRMLKALGISLYEDCISVNSVRCRPVDKKGNNVKPTDRQITACRSRTIDDIVRFKPKLILLMGESAVKCVIGGRWKKDLGTIGRWRGWLIPDQDYNAWILPTFHPSFLIRNERRDELWYQWEDDLRKAIAALDTPVPKTKPVDIRIIDDLSVLEGIRDGIISFDFETTGLKPHAKGHRIVIASVATSSDTAYTFMLPKARNECRPFLEILQNPNIKKIAHNMKFEDTWARERLRVEVKGWLWDSMLASHLLDNRAAVCGLKFQVYVHFGIPDYDSAVQKWLERQDDKNANSFNRVMEAVERPELKQKLLEYCALDSIYAYRLAEIQMKQMRKLKRRFDRVCEWKQ